MLCHTDKYGFYQDYGHVKNSPPPQPPRSLSDTLDHLGRNKTHDRRSKPTFATARYKVKKSTTFQRLLKEDNLIDRQHFWIQQGASIIKRETSKAPESIGAGAIALQDFQTDELIGCMKGSPVYMLHDDENPIYFSIESGKVKILASIEHCIFAENVCARAKLNKGFLKFSLGLQVSDQMKYINHSTSPNVQTQTFVPPEAVDHGATTETQVVLKRGCNLLENVAIALTAKRPIYVTNELILDYTPTLETIDPKQVEAPADAETSDTEKKEDITDHTINFQEMNHCPEVTLDKQTLSKILVVAKKIAPKEPRFKISPDSIDASKTPDWIILEPRPEESMEVEESTENGNSSQQKVPMKKLSINLEKLNIRDLGSHS